MILLCGGDFAPGRNIRDPARREAHLFRSACQSGEIGKPQQPLVIVRDHRHDLGLLEHKLGDEDGVRITGPAPREIAAMATIPTQQVMTKFGYFERHRSTQITTDFSSGMLNLFLSCNSSVLICASMNSYTHALTQEQVRKLRALLEESGFEFAPKEWTIFFAQKNKLSVAVYEKGPKVLVQGRGVEEFVQFELEPKILGEAELGYEEVHSPEMFEPHFGVDESGKGDFFGPLVISGVYVDRGIARKLLDSGVVDSKRSVPMHGFARWPTRFGKFAGLVETVLIGPAKYNELYEKFGNLNGCSDGDTRE